MIRVLQDGGLTRVSNFKHGFEGSYFNSVLQILIRYLLTNNYGGHITVSSNPYKRTDLVLITTVITYWLCDAVAPANLRLGSSLVTLGFSWGVAIGIIALGHFVIALAITANSVIGAKYHIPYTIQSRASFGFFFSFVVVFIRMLVGFFWYGINTYTGAQCVNAVIIAIWPSFQDVPNHLPESANITTQMMTGMSICFCIF